MQVMEKTKKPIGRPKKPVNEVAVVRSIRLTPDQWKQLDTRGMSELRKWLNSGTLYQLR